MWESVHFLRFQTVVENRINFFIKGFSVEIVIWIFPCCTFQIVIRAVWTLALKWAILSLKITPLTSSKVVPVATNHHIHTYRVTRRKPSHRYMETAEKKKSTRILIQHSLIRGVLIQSCSTGAKNFTNAIMYFVIHNSVVLSKILKIVVP